MIEFSSYYFIQEEDVEAIIKTENPNQEYPFVLIIRVRSGRDYSVSYQSKEAREVKVSVHDGDRNLEAIFNRLYLMDDRLRRVDKRGLRIW